MGRDAMSKLADADEISKRAVRLKTSDPESSRQLQEVARLKRKAAIKQLRRRPKAKRTSLGLGGI